MIRIVLAALGLLAAGAAFAQSSPPRTELPIREVVLSDGMRRYVVPVSIGGVAIDAGLDSGSTGLRLLASAAPPDGVAASTHRTSYSYSSGTRLDGVTAEAKLSLGALDGFAPIQLVSLARCTGEQPRCPASRIPFSQYGIQGDGLPGEGFKAIFGINMAGAEVPNPLMRLGVRRWIIELPRPGQAAAGRLILNPSDAETQGYLMFHVTGDDGGLHDALPGCLVNRQTRQSICGAAILDTGAPGLRIVTSDRQRTWPDGTPAAIAFVDGRSRAGFDLAIGLRAQASHLTMQSHDGLRAPRLFLGLAPYFAYSVLYDPAAGEIGLKPRDGQPGS